MDSIFRRLILPGSLLVANIAHNNIACLANVGTIFMALVPAFKTLNPWHSTGWDWPTVPPQTNATIILIFARGQFITCITPSFYVIMCLTLSRVCHVIMCLILSRFCQAVMCLILSRCCQTVKCLTLSRGCYVPHSVGFVRLSCVSLLVGFVICLTLSRVCHVSHSQ